MNLRKPIQSSEESKRSEDKTSPVKKIDIDVVYPNLPDTHPHWNQKHFEAVVNALKEQYPALNGYIDLGDLGRTAIKQHTHGSNMIDIRAKTHPYRYYFEKHDNNLHFVGFGHYDTKTKSIDENPTPGKGMA